MAARAELKYCCKELGIESSNLLIAEMKEEIRRVFDERYRGNEEVGIKQFSRPLLKFITEEYDYRIMDREGKKIDYNNLKTVPPQ